MKNKEVEKIVREGRERHLESLGKFRLQVEIPIPLQERIDRISGCERRNRNQQVIIGLEEYADSYESKNKRKLEKYEKNIEENSK